MTVSREHISISSLLIMIICFQPINNALERNTYLTGQFLTAIDVAAYYVLYLLLVRNAYVIYNTRILFVHSVSFVTLLTTLFLMSALIG